MSKRTLVLAVLLCAFLSPMFSDLAWGQALTSTPATVTLEATKGESISVTSALPATVTFGLNGGITPGSSPVSWTTSWTLKQSRNSVTVCVYLGTPGNLTGSGTNPDVLPPANIYGQPEGSGPFSALTSSACGFSNGLQIGAVTTITNANRKGATATRNDNVTLQIDETSPALSLSADTYSGTLNIVAQAAD